MTNRSVDAAGRAWLWQEWACPTCGPGPTQILGWRGGQHHRYGLGAECRIVRCRRCGLLFADPFPTPEDPHEIYGDPDKYFAGHDEGVKVENHRAMLRDVQRRLGSSEMVVLDIGSGRGELLVAAEAEGVGAVGLEFSQAMIDAAASRGLEVRRESAEEHASHQATSYNVIVLASVLEHVHDPDALVAAVSDLLRPGGIVYIECPSEPNLLTSLARIANRMRGSRAVVNLSPTFPPFHVYGFGAASLGVLLAKHGMVIEETRVRGAVEIPSGPSVGDRVQAAVGTLVQRLANRVGRGSNMEVWARKPVARGG